MFDKCWAGCCLLLDPADKNNLTAVAISINRFNCWRHAHTWCGRKIGIYTVRPCIAFIICYNLRFNYVVESIHHYFSIFSYLLEQRCENLINSILGILLFPTATVNNIVRFGKVQFRFLLFYFWALFSFTNIVINRITIVSFSSPGRILGEYGFTWKISSWG